MSDIGMILDRIGRKLVTEVAPKLEGDYSGGHAGMSGLMAVMAGGTVITTRLELSDATAEQLLPTVGAAHIAKLRGEHVDES